MPMAWPTGAPTRLGPVAHGLVAAQLAHLAAEGAVRVHDALGVGRRPRRVADDGRASGSTATGPSDRLGARAAPRRAAGRRASPPVVADHEDHLQVVQAVADGGQLGQVVALAVGATR